MAVITFRTNADGSAVCPHRDLSCCATCAAADRRVIYVAGAYFCLATVTEADATRASIRAAVDMVVGEVTAQLDDLSDDTMSLCDNDYVVAVANSMRQTLRATLDQRVDDWCADNGIEETDDERDNR